MKMLRNIIRKIVAFWKIADEVGRHKAVDVIEAEVEEMENIFGLLVLGSFVGLPSPPMQISLDLMPHMEKELLLMLEKVDVAHEPISQLFSVLDVG